MVLYVKMLLTWVLYQVVLCDTFNQLRRGSAAIGAKAVLRV